MPPLVCYLVIGFGSVVTVFGLVLLLMVLTKPPRAQQRLILGGQAWSLRPAAILIVLAGGLCMGWPFVYGPAAPPNVPSAPADSRGSHGHDRQVSPDHVQERPVDDDRGAAMPGGTGEMDPPGRRQQGLAQEFSPASSVNLTGEWMITNTVVETSYPPYRDLRLGFRLVVHHDGVAFTGTGEKYLENGHQIPVTARRPIRLHGRVVEGSVIEATFQEEGRARRTQGRFRLTIQERQHLTGTFVSTAANSRGTSQWLRATAHPRGSAPRREAPRQEGHVSPSPPDQGPPPRIALDTPVQGQQVTTAQIQVRGTATGAPGVVRVDVHVNGARRVQRTAPGAATVDFAEPIALRPGPNDIVVTAVDSQYRAARQHVTVTHVEARPQPPTPADPPRAPVPASHNTTREHRPRLQVGMSPTEVRDLLGEPVRVEDTPTFVFWYYGTEAYVVFEQGTGRAYGWVGVSS
jgi:hypothetical protein